MLLRSFLLLLILPLFNAAAAADFWQKEWAVPEYAEGNSLIIRPIESSDTDRLFHSYMTSQRWLYDRLGWSWPSQKSTPQQNETMVNYHLEQAKERTAFTYLVIYNAEVSWWLLESAIDDNLHNDFFVLLKDWLEASWPWRQVLFPVSENNETALQLLESSSARSLGRDLDAQERYFSYSISRK